MVRARLLGSLRPLPRAQTGAPPRATPGNRAEKLLYLSSIVIFRDLTPEDLFQLEQRTQMSTVRRGQAVYVPKETGELLFLLKKGQVQLYRLAPDGRKLVVAVLGPETFFGEMRLLGQEMTSTFAEALEDSTVCIMTRNDVEALIMRKPEVALRILEVLGQRLIEAEDQIQEIVFKRVPARVAALLLRVHEREQVDDVSLTHQEIAEMLGVYRETVTNAVDDLKRAGAVEVGRRRITILRPDILRKAAE